jgi:hypothetical protein
MKAKQLITESDLVVNPKGYFGDKIPYYRPCEGEYAGEHGSSNYGVYRAIEYANRKSAALVNAIVTYVYGYSAEERDKAFEQLREIAEEYKQED